MNALANSKVGDYVNEQFFASHQKVGTFQVVNGQKQGGNVATYICTPEGTVLHAIAGPVGANVYLRELRWAVEIHNKATTESRGDALRYMLAIRKAHYSRLQDEFGVTVPTKSLPPVGRSLPPAELTIRSRNGWQGGEQGQIDITGKSNTERIGHLLTAYPLSKLEDVYPIVWTRILNERLSTAPVKVQ